LIVAILKPSWPTIVAYIMIKTYFYYLQLNAYMLKYIKEGSDVMRKEFYRRGNPMQFKFFDSYYTNGSEFGLDEITRIKIQITYYDALYMVIYADAVRQLRILGGARDRDGHEFITKKDFHEFEHVLYIPKELFLAKMKKNGRIKTPEKIKLLECDKFLDYAYECMNNTMIAPNVLYRLGL